MADLLKMFMILNNKNQYVINLKFENKNIHLVLRIRPVIIEEETSTAANIENLYTPML